MLLLFLLVAAVLISAGDAVAVAAFAGVFAAAGLGHFFAWMVSEEKRERKKFLFLIFIPFHFWLIQLSSSRALNKHSCLKPLEVKMLSSPEELSFAFLSRVCKTGMTRIDAVLQHPKKNFRTWQSHTRANRDDCTPLTHFTEQVDELKQ